MEEKERYEIHIYDDICVDLYDNGVLDKSINDTYKLEELLNQQSKRLKDLEQENRELHTAINLSIPNQTAMKDEIERLHTCVDNRIDELENENQQLKQQLAEKDKQIDYYQSLLKRSCDECNIKLKTIKTNFALEQLEKVKEKALHFYVNDTPKLTGFYIDVNEIDNQINELKGKVEDVKD